MLETEQVFFFFVDHYSSHLLESINMHYKRSQFPVIIINIYEHNQKNLFGDLFFCFCKSYPWLSYINYRISWPFTLSVHCEFLLKMSLIFIYFLLASSLVDCAKHFVRH